MKKESNIITITIRDTRFRENSFRTDKNASLRRIFLDFCDRHGFVYCHFAFYFDGRRIHEMQTAEELGMADGDVIDAMVIQRGFGSDTIFT
ncbi:hypothetical protein C2S51_015678 [Perilla frutescens var. frutescens]|nr:hypothetical protein C2S51_015678 [Perilla frutescens var. frutescens]